MKKRIRRKLEKENIFISNFIKEYKNLNNIIADRDYYLDRYNVLREINNKLSVKETVISKSMYFALVGYLPKNISELFYKYQDGKIKTPYTLGKVFINLNLSEVSRLEEEIELNEINLKEYYIKILFKGLKIEIKIPINLNSLNTEIKGIRVDTKAWTWDFRHSGILILSDIDYAQLFLFFKSALELGELMK